MNGASVATPLVALNLVSRDWRGLTWDPQTVRRRPTPSLNEWAVLGVLVDRPRHGYDIAAELRAGAPIGDAWRVTRPLVYRALERLEALGLTEARRTEPGEGGPPRTVHAATRRGRSALKTWLVTPVEHLRDIRSELLLKLVLTERLGLERSQLVRAQRARFAQKLADLAAPPPAEDAIALWRHHSALGATAFLHALHETSADDR